MNNRSKTAAVIAVILGMLATIMSMATPAQAADPAINQDGWWNTSNGGVQTYERYTYPSYKINCNNNPDQSGLQVIVARKEGTTEQAVGPKLTQVRQMLSRTASIFAASRKATIGPNAEVAKYADLTPKFVTFQAADGNCYPTLKVETIPTAVYQRGSDSMHSAGGLWDYMRNTLGYNQANRKYLLLVQGQDMGSDPAGGISGYWYDDSNSRNNLNNYGGTTSSFATTWFDPAELTYSDTTFIARIAAHELGHQFGAVQPGTPNENAENPGHAEFSLDVMAYNNAGYGEQKLCTTQANQDRFDWCQNQAGFFEQLPDNWTSTQGRWAITSSSYLWGGKFLAPDGNLRRVMPEPVTIKD